MWLKIVGPCGRWPEWDLGDFPDEFAWEGAVAMREKYCHDTGLPPDLVTVLVKGRAGWTEFVSGQVDISG